MKWPPGAYTNIHARHHTSLALRLKGIFHPANCNSIPTVARTSWYTIQSTMKGWNSGTRSLWDVWSARSRKKQGWVSGARMWPNPRSLSDAYSSASKVAVPDAPRLSGIDPNRIAICLLCLNTSQVWNLWMCTNDPEQKHQSLPNHNQWCRCVTHPIVQIVAPQVVLSLLCADAVLESVAILISTIWVGSNMWCVVSVDPSDPVSGDHRPQCVQLISIHQNDCNQSPHICHMGSHQSDSSRKDLKTKQWIAYDYLLTSQLARANYTFAFALCVSILETRDF